MADEIPQFDPSQPFENVSSAPPFDPAKPFEPVGQTASPPQTPMDKDVVNWAETHRRARLGEPASMWGTPLPERPKSYLDTWQQFHDEAEKRIAQGAENVYRASEPFKSVGDTLKAPFKTVGGLYDIGAGAVQRTIAPLTAAGRHFGTAAQEYYTGIPAEKVEEAIGLVGPMKKVPGGKYESIMPRYADRETGPMRSKPVSETQQPPLSILDKLQSDAKQSPLTIPGTLQRPPVTDMNELEKALSPDITAAGPTGEAGDLSSARMSAQKKAAEFGIPLSRGQATQDMDAIRYEDMASRGAYGKPAQDVAKPWLQNQFEKIGEAGQNINERLAGEHPIAADTSEAAATVNEDIATRAEQARNARGEAQQAAQQSAEAQRRSVADQARTIEESLRQGRPAIENVRETGETVANDVRTQAAKDRAHYQNLYNEAFALPGEIHGSAFKGIGTRIQGDLSRGDNPVIIDDVTTPISPKAIKDLDNISNLTIQNLADPSGAPNPEDIVGVNLRGVNQARKRLVAYYQAARSAAPQGQITPDVRAMSRIIDAFDGQVEHSIANGLFSGDERALGAIQEARAAYRDYARTYRPQQAGDDVGAAIRRIVDRHATPEETVNMILGSGRIGNAGLPVRLADRLEQILGNESEGWNTIRQAMWQRASQVRDTTGEIDPLKSANNIEQFTGSSLGRRVFTPEELTAMRDHARAIRQLDRSIEMLPETAAAEQAARGYERMFSGEDIGGTQRTVFRRIAEGTATPEETSNAVFGAIGSGNPGNAARMIDAIERVVGSGSPTMAAIRQGVWQRITQAPIGKDQPGAQKLAQSINEFLNGRGKTIAEKLYSPEERDMMQRYADVVKQTVITKYARTNSDTAVAQAGMVRRAAFSVMSALSGHGLIGRLAHAGVERLIARTAERISDAAEARKVAESLNYTKSLPQSAASKGSLDTPEVGRQPLQRKVLQRTSAKPIPDRKVNLATIENYLNANEIPFRKDQSKSLGSLSSYYYIDTPTGVKKLRVSDHIGNVGEDANFRLGSDANQAFEKIGELREQPHNEFMARRADKSTADELRNNISEMKKAKAEKKYDQYGPYDYDGAIARNQNKLDEIETRLKQRPSSRPMKTEPLKMGSENDILKAGAQKVLDAEEAKNSPIPNQERNFKASGEPSIIAYHGSPHEFDKFDISRIGTGEGAQSYGHGLYFAEKEGVAKSYRDQLSKGATAPVVRTIVKGQPIEKGTPEFHASNLIADNNFSKADFKRLSKQWIDDAKNGDLGSADVAKQSGMSATEYFQRLHDFGSGITRKDVKREYSPGHMYQVEIKADPKSFLDWDAPIEKQPPQIMDLIRNGLKEQGYLRKNDNGPRQLNSALKAWKMEHGGMSETTMEALLSGRGGLLGSSPQEMTKRLLEAGIPGVRYFDQGSRSTQKGSRNYVVFDDKLVNTLKRYAIGGAVLPLSTRKESNYSPTRGKPEHHCGPDKGWPTGYCKHFDKPHSCHIVAGFIAARGGCDWFSPTQQERADGGFVCDDDANPEDQSSEDWLSEPPQQVQERASGGRVLAHYIDHNPTPAQAAAGNYRKFHTSIHGIPIAIENAKGSERSGIGADGKEWKVPSLPYSYGYAKKSEAKDGDPVDIMLGPHTQSKKVFVVDQHDAETGKYDEMKAMLGYGSALQARSVYLKGFSDGKGHKRLGYMTEMTIDQFKDLLKNYDTTKPLKPAEEALPKIDHSYDVRWLSDLNKDGTVMYYDKSAPRRIMNNGKPLDPVQPLMRHEMAEFKAMREALAEFKEKHGKEPDDETRIKFYHIAHKDHANIAERDWLQARGYSIPQWNKWCREQLARTEKAKAFNPPPNQDVLPVRHDRGDLEFADK